MVAHLEIPTVTRNVNYVENQQKTLKCFKYNGFNAALKKKSLKNFPIRSFINQVMIFEFLFIIADKFCFT